MSRSTTSVSSFLNKVFLFFILTMNIYSSVVVVKAYKMYNMEESSLSSPTSQDCKISCYYRCEYLMMEEYGEKREEKCRDKCKKKVNYCYSKYSSLECRMDYNDPINSVCYDNTELNFHIPEIVYENNMIIDDGGFEAVTTTPAAPGGGGEGGITKDNVIFAGDTEFSSTTDSWGIYVSSYDSNNNQFVTDKIIQQSVEVKELKSADLDGDGLYDLIISSDQPQVRYISNFTINSSESDIINIFDAESGDSHGSYVVDLNNDGIMDVITGMRRRKVLYFEGSQNVDDGGFHIGGGGSDDLDTFEDLTGDNMICGIHHILAVDLDGDGTSEIIVGGDSYPLSYLKKNEQASSSSSNKWDVNIVDPRDEYLAVEPDECDLTDGADKKPGTRYYCAADLNNDGITDLVSTYKWPVVNDESEPAVPYSASLVWYPGTIDDDTGSISFGPKNHLVGYMPDDGEDHGMFGLTCADFDGDGNIDIVATDRQSSQVLLIKSKGDGRFGYPRFVSLKSSHGCDFLDQITYGDLDGDGKPDLVTVCKKTPQVLWLKNMM